MTKWSCLFLILTLLPGISAMAQAPVDTVRVEVVHAQEQDSTFVQTRTFVDSMLTAHSGLDETECAIVSDAAILSRLQKLMSHGVPGLQGILRVLDRRRIL